MTRLMLDYAFTALGLHSVWLRVYAFNPGAVRAYTTAGFREFGRRRECKRLGQTLYDVIYMECLAGEVVSRESWEEPAVGSGAPCKMFGLVLRGLKPPATGT